MKFSNIAKLGVALALTTVASTGAFAGKKHFYKTEDGAALQICKDASGFTVYMADGATQTYGPETKWKDVKQRYNVKKKIRSGKKFYEECPKG